MRAETLKGHLGVLIREARRVLRPGGLFAACPPNRDSIPVFGARVDQVESGQWDGPLVTLAAG